MEQGLRRWSGNGPQRAGRDLERSPEPHSLAHDRPARGGPARGPLTVRFQCLHGGRNGHRMAAGGH
eukprot:8493817-Lingulodinium_polyedra.AAC.1